MSWGEGSMNWAELRDLVDALPEDAATVAAERGDKANRWTSSTYVGAASYNALLMVIQILWTAHLKGKPPEMEPIQPPRQTQQDIDDEQAVEAQRRSEEYLDSFSPGTPQSDQAEIDLWNSRIRELETAR